MSGPIPVLLLFGPTASGKTAILEELFTGPDAIPAEVVSADSMQVYRGMDIGTAKPDAALCAALPHHLVDVCNPDEQFSVGDFVRLSDGYCPAIWRRGALPVLSGGTAFYLKLFREGLPEAPPANPLVREAVAADFAARGAAALYEDLCTLDPVAAARIHPNDHYRIQRALEVCRGSGRALSSFSRNADDSSRPSYRFLSVHLVRERASLYQRIDRRCADMFRAGLAEEVSALFYRGYTASDPGMKAIGYREFFGEDGRLCPSLGDPAVLASIEALVARNSRRYAKRQESFFAVLGDRLCIDLDREAPAEARSRLNMAINTFLKA